MKDRPTLRQHPLYRVALWLALALSLGALWQMNQSVLSDPKYIPVDDFAHYWAAGRLNLAGGNPYHPDEIQRLRQAIAAQEIEYASIPIMWTPPWSLLVVMPFGVLGYQLSRLSWLIAHIALILVSANICWKIYGGKPEQRWVAWGTAFLLGPTISVLEKGQITPWVLIGLVGWIYFVEVRRQPFLAGLMLVLIALKPQVVYLFWLAGLLWIIRQRAWKVGLGGGVGLAFALAVAMVFNPQVIAQYAHALTTYPPTDWATPTIGGYLRLLLGVEKFWLQWIPPLAGLLWFSFIWIRHRNLWNWAHRLPELSLISILTAPYAWTYDQVILVPAMILAAAHLAATRNRPLAYLLGLAYLGMSLLDLFLHRHLDEFWFGWLAPGLFLWFILVLRLAKSNEEKTSLTTASIS